MKSHIEFAAADREFYAPLEHARDDGEAFGPSHVPVGWSSKTSGVWTMWHRPGLSALAEDGWKVHVSARPERLRQVLDQVAGVCFEHEVVFKHLSTKLFYWWMSHKHAPRAQSGKLIAAYPADVDQARRLMERLRAELAREEGPYILSDRRFRNSRTVYYRYGAFVRRFRLQADGTRTMLVRGHDGRLIPDRRGVSFHLPDGIVDPFAETASPADQGVDFGGLVIESSVRHSNAGGAYHAREIATGRRVFVKEARPHTGLGDNDATAPEQLRQEWEVLTALQALAPGLAPEPISYFRVWEHDFMAMEHVEGTTLASWVAINHPLFRAGSTPRDFAAFYERCEKIISAVELALEHLHSVGYLFVDVSPNNVLVDENDAARLIDFGSAHRLGDTFAWVATPGYTPPRSMVGEDLSIYDHYGMSALAQLLLGPMQLVLQRNPAGWAHMYNDLLEVAPVPRALWMRATRYRVPDEGSQIPSPEQVSADPVLHLAALRDRVGDALIAMADFDNPERVFPTIPQGYASNTMCVAYGTAGVVHALRRAGKPMPEHLVDRLRRDALDKASELAPGLYVGTAGIAWVLSDCGLIDEACDLLARADSHPLARECATLFGGAAGVALAHLALYGQTRNEDHVDRALALAAALPADAQLTQQLGADNATGLMNGRCGIALFLQQLAGVTGEGRYLTRAVRLLHDELDRAIDLNAPGLLFPGSDTDRRALPYLGTGSAGMVYATTRCLRAIDDERLAEALPRMLAPLGLTYTIMPGLLQGLAGYAFTLADHAALSDDQLAHQASMRVARSLFKYATPHSTGVRFLGDQLLRYSAELWSGSAGVLLALNHVLDPRPDALFTVDALINERHPVTRHRANLAEHGTPIDEL